MTTLERVGALPIVEKMVETRFKWFGHVERRYVNSILRRVDHMERIQITRVEVEEDLERLRKTIKKDLQINNELDRNVVFDTIIASFDPCNRPYLVG
jgi:ABC-type phosphate transport system auxiliary subunit